MAIKSVGYRLHSEGKAELKNDFAEVKTAGVDSMKSIADAAVQAGAQAAAASDRYTERQIEGYRKQAAAAKLAAAGVAASGSVDQALGGFGNAGQFATVNLDRSSGAAKESAAIFAAQIKQQDDAQAAALRLKAALDPLWAAQARYDDELRSHNSLLEQGAIDEKIHAAAVDDSGRRLRETERAIMGTNNALGLNRMQFIVGAGAARNFVDSVLAGASPMRAFMQQAGDVATVLQMDDGGVAGGLAKVRSLLTPTTLAISASVAALAIGAGAWLSYSNSVEKFNALAVGAGRNIGMTGEELEASASAAARAGDISVSAARDIEASYVLLGRIGGDNLTRLTAMTKDFAAATGVDAKAATQTLGQAFLDPIAGAQMLAEKYGAVDQATIEYIAHLVEQNDMTGAQRALLDALAPGFDGAAEHANILARAWDTIANSASNAWDWMGKAIDRMATGGSLSDQIKDLEAKRDNPALKDYLTMGDPKAYYQKQIDDLRSQARQEAARTERDQARAAQQAGQNVVDSFTGANQLDAYRKSAGTLRGALATDISPDQRKVITEALDAYTHAIDTFIPKQEKANELSAIDARIAAAKTPAARAELATQRSMIESKGELVTASQAEAKAQDAGSKAKAEASRSGAGHAATLAREADAMEVSARAALSVAEAYLKTSAAGLEAEARRKALTDATRKGIDTDEQVRRQLALQVAEGAANGAKAVAGLRDETAARAAVNDNVAAGKIAAADMSQALADEAALRPLLTLRAIAQGDALKQLTDLVDAYRSALAKAHVEEARGQADLARQALDRRIEDAELAARYAGDSSGAYEREKARIAAEREAVDRKYGDGDKGDLAARAARAANADLTAGRAGSAAQALRSERDRLEITSAEIGLLGKSADEHDRIIGRLQLQQQLAQSLGDQYAQFAPEILAARDAADAANAKLKVATASMDELRRVGTDLIDEVLDTDRIKDWGDVWSAVTSTVKRELIELMLINPLKNLIGGGGLPTLSSVFSLFGGGGGSTFGSGPTSPGGPITFTAAGSENFGGGLTWVNENGPEIADLPNGTRIYPAAATRRMLAANDTAGPTVHHWHLEGAVVTQDLLDQMNAIGDGAAIRGAQGGASLAQTMAGKRARRTMR